jgi:hypothetical protein
VRTSSCVRAAQTTLAVTWGRRVARLRRAFAHQVPTIAKNYAAQPAQAGGLDWVSVSTGTRASRSWSVAAPAYYGQRLLRYRTPHLAGVKYFNCIECSTLKTEARYLTANFQIEFWQ